MKIDLSNLKLAISQLQKSLDYCNSELAKKNPGIYEQFRSAAIQAFEYTYELAWKMLRRYLAKTSAAPTEIDELSFPNLIRLGTKKRILLSDWEKWKHFRDMRNITSHTYDLHKAEEILLILPEFLTEARYLLSKLEEQNILL